MLEKNRDYSAGYGMKPMVAHVCAGTVFWMDRGGGNLIKIVVQTNPSENGWQDYLIYYYKDDKPAEAMALHHQMLGWWHERWLGIYTGVDSE